MNPHPDLAFEPATVAEAWLGLLAAHGVDILFVNGGTDFAPLAEAYAKGLALGWKMPRPISVPHENVGVAMAHGYTMLTGRAQAMMVHVGPGTANAVNGLYNAYRQRIPMLFTAGRTPILEAGGVRGSRNNFINWAQEMYDQAGMVRGVVKWDYELRHPQQVESVLERALVIAHSAPQGPVYLTLPREVLAADLGGAPVSLGMIAVPAPRAPAADAIARAAGWLAQAKHPLIITSNCGRTAGEARALQQLAERLAIPVIHYRPRHLALATSHPLAAGWDPHALLKNADCVLAVDCDVPWIPAQGGPLATARVVQLGVDPLWSDYPMRGFRSDLTLDCDTQLGLGMLAAAAEALDPGGPRALPPAKPVRQAPPLPSGNTITPRYVSACLSELLDADTLVVNEYPLTLEDMALGPGQYFSHPPSGGLGWGLGAALGAKLAAPGKTLICAVGDGAYMFGNPTPAHWIAQAQGLPVLFVVFNNARWGAVHRATLSLYPDGYAAKAAVPPFTPLDPSPQFEKICEACGGWGERVTAPAAVMPALKRALDVVRKERRQALLNIEVEVTTARTS
jgi:acetolactate synthase-1/2/3 large subunit